MRPFLANQARILYNHQETFPHPSERSLPVTRKQWACLALTLLTGALALIITVVVVIDPFEV